MCQGGPKMADGKKSWRKWCVAQTSVFLIHIFTSNLSFLTNPALVKCVMSLWEEDLLRWTPARMHLMLLLYYQSLMPPLPTSCLVSSSLCNEYLPQNPAYLDLFLQQVANFCLPSMLRDRPTGQRQPFPKQRSEVASKSQRYLRLRPGFGGHPITQLPIFNLSPLRSLFTVSLRWWTPPPTPTPVWPFLLLCDWLEWTEDEAEKVPTKIPAPRSHLLRWSTSHGQSSSKVPILILSQSINRAGGAFPNISGPAQNCLPSQIHHSFQNILENYFLFLEMSLQGYLVVFRRNLFSAVNRTLTTCVCQPADLGLSRLSLMVQGHTKYEIDKAQENFTSLNWSQTLFKTLHVNLGWLIWQYPHRRNGWLQWQILAL